jgi:kynureninase
VAVSGLPRRAAFSLPRGIYLDGNSLGPLPLAAQAAIERRLRQWQHRGVNAWDDWFALAERLSPALARLIGAHPDETIACGGITVNLHALLATFYRPQENRRALLASELDFPSDLYALKAWAERTGGTLELIRSRDGHTLHPDDIDAALHPGVALAWLPTVLYRSGQALDVGTVTSLGRARGILMGWDAAHSIGALPHTFHDDGVDMAVWCSYKYLNAGPGAPGGLFVHRRWHHLSPGLPGWWGNDKRSQFEMTPDYRKAAGASAFQIGTPSILALAGLEGALATFEEVGIAAIRRHSLALTDHLIAQVDAELPELALRTPRRPAERGGHVALAHPAALQLSLALRARSITADHRPPDLLRVAPVALYNTFEEIDALVAALRELLDSGSYLAFDPDVAVT